MSTSARLNDPVMVPRSGARLWLTKLLVFVAYAFPGALVLVYLALHYVGEHWWVTAAALYAPRLPLAIPLPFIVAALWFLGLRRLLWTQLVAAMLIIVPLSGFCFPKLRLSGKGPVLRVLSFNVDSGFGGTEAILNEIMAAAPDIVLLQEAPPWKAELKDALQTRFPFVQASTQFIVASRFAISSAVEPAKLPFFGRERSPRFMRYVLETPLGPVVVYSVHPVSPRGLLNIHQFRGAFHELRTGHIFEGDPETSVASNMGLRSLQMQTVGTRAASEAQPVIIAGDTNLPGLSAIYDRWLAEYEDGFSSTSWGFGYTYPTKHPFLRLDRILTNRELRVASFKVACRGVSDHLCVTAEIQARQ